MCNGCWALCIDAVLTVLTRTAYAKLNQHLQLNGTVCNEVDEVIELVTIINFNRLTQSALPFDNSFCLLAEIQLDLIYYYYY